MTEEIVACPACAKKFRIPEGAQTGSFACTACGANVPYGMVSAPSAARAVQRPAARAAAPAASTATRHAAAAAARPAARAGSGPAPQVAAARAGTRPVAAAPQRAPAPAAPRQVQRHAREEVEPPKKTNPAIVWGGIGAGVAVIVVAYLLAKPEPPVTKPFVPPTAPTRTKPSEAARDPAPPPDGVAVGSGTAGSGAPVVGDAQPPAAKPSAPASKPAAQPAKTPTADVMKGTAVLGKPVSDVAGVSQADRDEMDKMVALMMNLESGREGTEARGKLKRLAKKAIPPLLTAFNKQYEEGKWSTEAQQYGAFQIQELLRDITAADRPQDEFKAVFQPGGLSPPADFERALRIWNKWWNNKGMTKESYRKFDD